MAANLPRVRPPPGKLRPPRLGRSFDRERLFEQMDAAAAVPGLWITGPPGFGKTTLVATYLEARQLRCAWLQLDAGDTDPSTFFHFLRQSVQALSPRRRLRLPVPTADDLRDVPAFVRRCVRRMAQALDGRWALVLDNVQELDRSPLLHAGIAAMMGEMPEGSRLVAISREPPSSHYVSALARQQLQVIDTAALRFTADETSSLLRLHDRPWAPDLLCRLTDGWAAAMILLVAVREELEHDITAPDSAARQRLFDFFAGEVIRAMEPAACDALMRIAFLPSATAAMATTISGNPRAGAILADLARRSLFTDRRDAPSPVYAFHALFGEFLRARALNELAPGSMRALRLDAAALLAAHGRADAAIGQLMDAAAFGEASTLLLEHAASLVAQGRTALVRGWLQALPDAFATSAQVRYWLGFCELALDPVLALRHLEHAHRGFVAAGDVRGSFLSAAAAADAIIFRGANFDALAPWMPILASHAPLYLADRCAEDDLRVLPGLLAAFVHRDPGHSLTAALADAAENMLDQPLGASQRILLGTLAYYLLWTGQTPRLDRIMRKIDTMAAEQDAAPATLLRWYGVGVLIRSLLGRVDEALASARHALTIAAAGPPAMQAKAHLLMVIAAEAARDADLARVHLAEAAGVLVAGNPVDVTTYEFQRGMLMFLDADWRGAAQLMRSAVMSGRASGWPLREHIALLGQALAATQVDSFTEAEEALQAALDHPFYAACRWHHWIAALIESHLAERRGQRARALAALRRAFGIGRECGYDFGPMPYCCGDMMSGLAALALRHDIDTPFAMQIVRRHALPPPPDADASWPWPIRIRSLGGFALRCDEAPERISRKESRKPLDLLKLLLALGGQNVPVARLCASLWPEAAGDAARNSFDNTLHRLRALLGSDHHVNVRGGGVSLNAATCWTDLGALERCLANATALHEEQVDGAAPVWVDDVLALYRGEFLAGEDDLPEVLVARNRVQARVTSVLAAQAQWLQTNARHAEAARLYQHLVDLQPLAEEWVRPLMRCLLQLGRRSEALQAYRRCRELLSVVLGIRPAAETEMLAAGLHNL